MRLLIFDFDGTLADTFPEIVRALNTAMEELGYPLAEPDAIRRWIGYGLREFMARALPADARDDGAIAELTERYRKRYREIAFDRPRLFDGVVDVLDSLGDDTLAIASNKSVGQLEPLVKALGVRARFRAVVGGDSTSAVKPDTGVYTFLLEELENDGALPGDGFDKVCMVGDSEPDMEFARNIGATAVGCLWGLREKEDLVSAGADFIAEEPRALMEILR